MKVITFLDIADNRILPCIRVRKRMLKLDEKRKTSLEPYLCWPKEMICKSGKRIAYLWKDVNCRNDVFLYKAKVWRVCLFCQTEKYNTRNDAESILYDNMISI